MASSDEPRGGPPAAVEDADPGVSRRAFLKSVGVTSVVAGVVAEAGTNRAGRRRPPPSGLARCPWR